MAGNRNRDRCLFFEDNELEQITGCLNDLLQDNHEITSYISDDALVALIERAGSIRSHLNNYEKFHRNYEKRRRRTG